VGSRGPDAAPPDDDLYAELAGGAQAGGS
jgi:hypothetical protein